MEQHTQLEMERMQQMLLSSHFTLGEFLRSFTFAPGNKFKRIG